MKRTAITISDEDFKEILEFAKFKDMKISSILRKGAKELIQKENVNRQ